MNNTLKIILLLLFAIGVLSAQTFDPETGQIIPEKPDTLMFDPETGELIQPEPPAVGPQTPSSPQPIPEEVTSAAEAPVKTITITEEELRRIIREEIARAEWQSNQEKKKEVQAEVRKTLREQKLMKQEATKEKWISGIVTCCGAWLLLMLIS